MALQDTLESLQALFESCCLELFHSHGSDVMRVHSPGRTLEGVPIACIDAGGEDLELAIVMRIPMEVLALTYPDSDSESILSVDETKLEDWIAELANQLVGRLKNKLLTCNCTLKIGLPATYFDVEYDHSAGHAHQFDFYFDVDKELFECSLYVDIFNDQLSLVAQPPADDAVGEGELELF